MARVTWPDAAGAPAPLMSQGEAATLVEANQQLVLATLRVQVADDELREAARHKDEFLAMVGHEFRNPLVPIRNVAALLLQIGSDPKRLAWAQDVLLRQVDHLSRLVDDLLDLSLVSRGSLRIQLQPLDLRQIVVQALERAAPLTTRRQHRLSTQLPAQPVWSAGDAIRLAQVFDNLLTNATKYTDDGGSIDVTLQLTAGQAVFHLRDSGLGITAEMLPRIFELFVQDARAIDRSQGGLGIGLALVQHLLKLHDGSVQAFSDGAGKGSEFVVRLPQLAAEAVAAHPPAATAAVVNGRVLIVDDDVEVGETMALLLDVYGYRVARAVDLASALRAGQAFCPQVVLMDIALPGADGYEVARQMRLLPHAQQISFIAVSGFGQPADRQRSAAAGFVEHLVKPVDPAALDGHLRRAFAH